MNEKDQKNYIKLTEAPVESLICRLAVPTTISMLVTSIYNSADTYFVSKIGVSASAATGIVFALMAILQAFGFMFGHGSGSNLSRLLGAREYDKANTYCSTGFFSALIVGVTICILGNIFITPLMYLLGSTDTILYYATIYARYILIGAPALVCSCVMNNILRYEGRATYAMIGLTSGGILNIILDPVFIFGLNMGIGGAGLATALSLYIGAAILITPFLRGRTSSKIKLKCFTKEFYDIKNIVYSGLPNLCRQGLNAISTSILNSLASVYGDAAIASFSIVSRISAIVFAASVGFGQGAQPVIAFNYGAKKYNRVRKAARFTISICTTIITALGILIFINSNYIIQLFRDEKEILEIGGQALRYMCIGMIFLPVTSASSMVFQCIGQRGSALITALLQSGLVYIPLMLILTHFLGINGLEMAQPMSYAIVSSITIPMIVTYLHSMKKLESS